MSRFISQMALLVRDYDEAISFFTRALRFELLEDSPLGNGKRWVRVAPSGGAGGALLLARAATPEQERSVGSQSGGRVPRAQGRGRVLPRVARNPVAARGGARTGRGGTGRRVGCARPRGPLLPRGFPD